MSVTTEKECLGTAKAIVTGPLGLPIGSQTYPHRQRIKAGDFSGLCRDLADLGVRDLEMCAPDYEEFASLTDGKQVRKILDDHGLKSSSGHFGMKILRSRQQEMIAWAKEIGMTQMCTATLEGPVRNGTTTLDAVRKASDEYNRMGAEAARAGLQQVLHDEGFELSKLEGDDRLTYEVLLETLDPELVKMQFQMSAMRTVGDPVMYFNKYPGRFISMHLQGVDLNAPIPAGWGNAAVGHDSLDWPKIFAAARIGGLKNSFVEQDWDLTVQGVTYLRSLVR